MRRLLAQTVELPDPRPPTSLVTVALDAPYPDKAHIVQAVQVPSLLFEIYRTPRRKSLQLCYDLTHNVPINLEF